MCSIVCRTRSERGFTLVELLVVISIIGVLVSLLMPAVQSAQEMGRMSTCSNNLHQMALGCTGLEAKFGAFPGGGWGWQWAGEADRGIGATQPGGWHFQILPFIGLDDLHDMGEGLTKPGDNASSNTARRQQGMLQAQTAVGVFICPSRHRVQAYPRASRNDYVNIAEPAPIIGRSDYAGNGGTDYMGVPGADDDSATITIGNVTQTFSAYATNYPWNAVGETLNSGTSSLNPTASPNTGVICVGASATAGMIKDGLSNTYLIGERYLDPNCYYSYVCCDNDQGWDQGFDWDTIRGTGQGYVNSNYSNAGTFNGNIAGGQLVPTPGSGTPIPPARDQRGYSTNGGCSFNFGSSHASGFNMAFCDGSVQRIGYDIDPVVHMQLGHRADGEPTDMSGLSGGSRVK